MTETQEIGIKALPEAVSRFVAHWGSMGEHWGVNRSVSQVHALLYLSERPLTAEDIANALGIARSNVSTSLRELQTWDLIRRAPVLGDRRDFFEAETDIWSVVTRIAAGRKARELDPAAAALRDCLSAAATDGSVSGVAVARLKEMLDFVDRSSRWYEQMLALPRSQVAALMKMGGGIARLLGRGAGDAKRRASAKRDRPQCVRNGIGSRYTRPSRTPQRFSWEEMRAAAVKKRGLPISPEARGRNYRRPSAADFRVASPMVSGSFTWAKLPGPDFRRLAVCLRSWLDWWERHCRSKPAAKFRSR
jgi:DNA-binding transcriptional regulator GbsR (MarR family)